MPTLLTQNQSFVLLPTVKAVAFFCNGLPNTGCAAVYEMSDVFLCLFFYCLNINPLKSCTKAVVSNLIKRCIHPSDFNKAVSCCRCEAVVLLWPFVFRVTCLDIVPSLK